jgi:thioredoxin-related protein
MHKNGIVLVIILIFPLIAYFYASKTNTSSVSVSETTKPQVIKFTSNMCSECQRMDIVVREISPRYKDKIQFLTIPVQVQNDYNKQMISKYNVTLVPTTIYINKSNKIIKRTEGYVDRNNFEKNLKALLND